MNWNEQKKLLKELGYDSYRDYLSGIIWANIHDKVFEVKGKKCVICNRDGTVIHHRCYTESVIRGTDIAPLEILCWDCHNRIEYDKYGNKLPLIQVNQKLDWYKNNKEVWTKNKWSSICLGVVKEHKSKFRPY